MDQYPAQPQMPAPPVVPEYQQGPPVVLPSSPYKRFFPLIILLLFVVIIGSGAILLLAGKSARNGDKTPLVKTRPTPTSLPEVTLPAAGILTPTEAPVSPAITATVSATPAVGTEKIGQLLFIKDGDIYQSDFASYSLFVKNATAAGDKLSWSPKGNYVSWRPKTISGIPQTLTIYSVKQKSTVTFTPGNGESSTLLDYAWSPDESFIAMLSKENARFSVSVGSVSTPSAGLVTVHERSTPIRQLVWPTDTKLFFSADNGIYLIQNREEGATAVANMADIQTISISPDTKKLLIATGDAVKSKLYILDVSSSVSAPPVQIQPQKTDMGGSGVPSSAINNGFIPYGIWFPGGDKLILGYHYLTNLPVVGIFDIANSSFKAIAPFTLYDSDRMIDNFRMVGNRVKTVSNVSNWQVSIFTLEDDAKLGVIRVIPGASSPSFYFPQQ